VEVDGAVVDAVAWQQLPLAAALRWPSDAGTVAGALTALSPLLPLVLPNTPAFPLGLAQALLAHVVGGERHHFLVRALFLAEVSRTPLPLLFQQRTQFSKPLLMLFCAFAIDWAVALIGSIRALEPVRAFPKLVRASAELPPAPAYVLRVMMIMALLVVGDARAVFGIFVRFATQVLVQIARAKRIARSEVVPLLAQVLVAIDRDSGLGAGSLALFSRFLQSMLRRVPKIAASDPQSLPGVEAFVDAHEREVSEALRPFMDQPLDEHILVFFFPQNLRCLANQQTQDRSSWVSLTGGQ
jgi:hypothetical protein